jgi:hypothetical protein
MLRLGRGSVQANGWRVVLGSAGASPYRDSSSRGGRLITIRRPESRPSHSATASLLDLWRNDFQRLRKDIEPDRRCSNRMTIHVNR